MMLQLNPWLILHVVCLGFASANKANLQEIFGFQDVMGHLALGFKVSFVISDTDCNDPSSLPGEFHTPFGGTIDMYFQFNQDNIMTTQFTTSKFERTQSGQLVTILRQAFLQENDEAHWLISVLTADKSKVISSWSFTCPFGNSTRSKNSLRIFADESNLPEQLHSVDDVKTALMAGKQVRYSAMLFLCSGDVPWQTAGGHMKGNRSSEYSGTRADFDIDENTKSITSSMSALVRDTAKIKSEYILVTSSLHMDRTVLFSVTDNEAVTFNTTFSGHRSCYMQTVMPGGTVNYYVN